MHLILTGATGLVGASVLHNMLAQQSVSRVSILSRRPVAMAEGHDKVKVFIHDDYKNYGPELLEELKDAQGCVWAQGVSQNDVSKESVQASSDCNETTKLTGNAENMSRSHTIIPSPSPAPCLPSTALRPSHSCTSLEKVRRKRLACSHPSMGA